MALGVGMVTAQAYYVVHDLANLLEVKGGGVEFAIHPVFGSVIGHYPDELVPSVAWKALESCSSRTRVSAAS